MGPVSSVVPSWDLHVFISHHGRRLRPCALALDHFAVVNRLTAGCSPDSPRDEVVRALPDPQSWVAMDGGFFRTFPCGCSLHLVPFS